MSKKILIVEDEKSIARALELKLTHEGFDARTVFDGAQALLEIDKEKFDLIICDLVMPKIDGFQIMEHIREKKITTPVIVLSNLTQEEDREKVIALGARDFFVKSNTPIIEIVEHVKTILK